MRNNQPVTRREYEFPADATLMSTTDTQSYITYANAAFIAVSGFDRDEILGQPHNMVRHPDMPSEAFGDLWATLKKGKSWTALVKNRRKSGDHYWVRANATPIVRHGSLQGYMSVRTKPSAQEVSATEDLYRRFREGRQGAVRFHEGLVVRTGLLSFLSLFQTLGVRGRIRIGVFGLALATVLASYVTGIDTTNLGILAGVALLGAVLASGFLERQIA